MSRSRNVHRSTRLSSSLFALLFERDSLCVGDCRQEQDCAGHLALIIATPRAREAAAAADRALGVAFMVHVHEVAGQAHGALYAQELRYWTSSAILALQT